MENNEFRELYARMEDLSERARRGELAISDFLSPGEERAASTYLKRRGISFFSYGGYSDAERKRVYFLPDYVIWDESGANDPDAYLEAYGEQTDVALLKIEGSGYRVLSHRDFLGSLLGLGLERSVLGDLLVESDGRTAFLFCKSAIVPFLTQALERVATDRVHVRPISESDVSLPKRKYSPIRDTVASARLDCVVAALCGLSREKARGIVCDGIVEVDYETKDRPDWTVTAPCLVSVRGFGKYRICSVSDQTRKGRYRLEAEKFI